jgi:glycosyltransferase involved in cell wall biosynthesis
MGRLYATLVLSFLILFVINIIFGALTLYAWITGGLQSILHGMNFGERIATSNQIKWIILVDFVWLGFALVFLFKRKHYKTDPDKHYLSVNPIIDPKICVIIPTYNEQDVVSQVVSDYKNQKFISTVLVVDNHSTDDTVKLAKISGANVIEKSKNLGYAHSCYIGLKEAIKNNSNIIVLTECDGTFAASDIQKMIPYLDNCDMIIGTRQVQVLTEKGNQNSMFYVWGNLFIAKLLQLKYFSLLHMGVINLTDVGCSYRAIRKDSLEKIIEQLESSYAQKVIHEKKGWLFTIFLTMLGISNDLKIVEIPITFKKRVGTSKSQANQKKKGLVYGLNFIWFIVSS